MKSDRNLLIIVLVAVLLAVGGYLYWDSRQNDQTDSSNNTTEQTENTNSANFTSAEDLFSVDFPSEPVKSENTVQVQGYDVPITSYTAKDGDDEYAVSVFKYPSEFDLTDVDARLSGALNGAVGNVDGAKLVKSEAGELSGQKSLEGSVEVAQGDQTKFMKLQYAFNGNTLYSLRLITNDASSANSKFDTFTNSFQLN